MKFLLDTCVLSELQKKIPNENAIAWLQSQDETSFYMSVITIGEIEKGIAKLPDDSPKKAKLADWLALELIPRFSGRLLDLGMTEVRVWGQMLGASERNGIIIPAIDALIGATAIAKECTLVTRKTEDFKHIGCNVLNIWGD